jgi:putative tryptophan/tyrosine transport system substrate-binding protein
MRRRDILTVIGGAAALTLPLRAQPLSVPLIGYIGPESPEPFASRLKAFREGLSESGFAEGRNIAIEYRWAQGQYNRLPALAADLASRKPAVIVAAGGPPQRSRRNLQPTV